MTTGVTYRNWNGKPALTQDGEARAVLVPGGGWTEADWSVVVRQGASIGEAHFADIFAGWNVPDLEGWYQRRDPNRPYDSYAKARRAAFQGIRYDASRRPPGPTGRHPEYRIGAATR